ncbi:MAG TPA: molybdate ABC transporter substrate-binding protein [Alphaproteobacteria bacterium]|nr:molybdate ABC transporter substrate-binding protein [Alphaproteobacteria bacterium]
MPLKAVTSALAGLLLAWRIAVAAEAPVIAVAANLTEPMREIAAAFESEREIRARLSFGSSGNFVRQIQQGAPFELILAADEDSIERLRATGHVTDQGAVYAVGRLALFIPSGSSIKLDPELMGLGEALRLGAVRRIAIANPEHAPYGRAAEQTLRRSGLWELARPRLVLGENIGQAAQFVVTGAAEAGFIAYSIALAPSLKDKGRFVVMPEAAHGPIRQRMALLAGASDNARALYEFMSGATARRVLERYGYAVPGAQ